MKNIYCIERWMDESEPVRDGWWGFFGIWEYYKIGKFSYVTEYEDEEEFKKELVNDIAHGGIISDVFIREVPDDYDMKYRTKLMMTM